MCPVYGGNSDLIYELKIKDDVFYCDLEPLRTHDCRRCTGVSCKEKECGYDVYEVRTILLAGLTSAEVHLLDKKVNGATHTGQEIPFRGHGLTLNMHIVYTDEYEHGEKKICGRESYRIIIISNYSKVQKTVITTMKKLKRERKGYLR